MKKPFNRNAVESFLGESKTGATALRLKTNETRRNRFAVRTIERANASQT